MREYRFRIALSAERYLAHYQGLAREVVVTADDGTRVAFPAEHLRAHVTRDGVFGRFVLRVHDDNRFHSLRRVGD